MDSTTLRVVKDIYLTLQVAFSKNDLQRKDTFTYMFNKLQAFRIHVLTLLLYILSICVV